MFGTKVVWGIDIGETAVRAVKMKVGKADAQVLVLDMISRSGRAEGYSYVDKEEQIRHALATLVKRHKFGSAKVAMSVPGASFDRFISLPAVSMKQVPQIVRYEARQQIPFPLEEVAWDYQLASDRPRPGEGLEVALFAIKTQLIEQALANLSAAKLGVDIIGMGHLALYNFLRFDRQIDSGTMIIDVGAANTDIVILADGNFRVRSVPIAGEAVTKMLQQKFGVSNEEAEELKKKASQSKQPDKLFLVMKPTFEKLLGEIHKTIGYYKQQFKTLKIDQAFLVGESFKLQPLVALFAESLGCKVSVLSSFDRTALAPAASTSEHAANLASFVPAMGLALQAAGVGPITINVLPDEVKAQRELWRKRPYAAGIAACFGLGVLAAFVGVQTDAVRLRGVSKDPEQFIKDGNERGRTFRTESDVKDVTDQIARIATLGSDRGVVLDAANCVATVYDKVPIGIFIEELKFEAKEKVVEIPAETNLLPGPDSEARTPPAPEVTYEMSIKGWTERSMDDVYKQFLSLLKEVPIFGTPSVEDVKFEEADGGKRRTSYLVKVTINPRSVEQKEAEQQ